MPQFSQTVSETSSEIASSAPLDLKSLAADVVAQARKWGATEAEAMVSEGDEFSVSVRMGEVETLQESGSRGLGLRVFVGQRSASASTSDLTPDGVAQLVAGALALARVTEEDPFAGIPDQGDFGAIEGDLHLYFEDVYSLPATERIDRARRAEAAALDSDPRITNSQGGGFDAATGRRVLANSRGFLGEYRTSYCGLSAAPLAMDANGNMQRDSWWSGARRLGDLESPEAIGQEAARRALRRLGARRVPTQRVPIVFAPEVARSLLGHLFEAASGDSIWRSASFLAGQLDETIAALDITLIDDGGMVLPGRNGETGVGGFGTSPFDGEGLPSRRTVVVENGVLRNYLLNTYTARKLQMRSTGNATRGLTGSPGIGAGNLYLQPGKHTPEEILAGVPAGLYVTSLMGFGANLVTGDYSRGASGLWIENGELTHAVEEVTIAGNLREMLRNITAIGSDLVFRGSVASPTLRVDGMTVAGA